MTRLELLAARARALAPTPAPRPRVRVRTRKPDNRNRRGRKPGRRKPLTAAQRLAKTKAQRARRAEAPSKARCSICTTLAARPGKRTCAVCPKQVVAARKARRGAR